MPTYDETRANLRRLEHLRSPGWWHYLRTALSSEHIIHRAPSDKMAVISTLVLIFVSSRGQERKYAHSEIPENYGENFLLIFIIVSVIAIRER